MSSRSLRRLVAATLVACGAAACAPAPPRPAVAGPSVRPTGPPGKARLAPSGPSAPEVWVIRQRLDGVCDPVPCTRVACTIGNATDRDRRARVTGRVVRGAQHLVGSTVEVVVPARSEELVSVFFAMKWPDGADGQCEVLALD